MNRIRAALLWRRNYYYQQILKRKWEIKRIFNFSEREKVDAVSVIVVGRNDNYGGDFSERLRATLDWNLKHLPNPELIYVEWNHIEGNQSDCDWIVQRYQNAKCYIVPNAIHEMITINPKMLVMEYFGKNVGIRRASNDWIILLNSDIIIGSDVIKKIKNGISSKFVYGTHYVNIVWDKKPFTGNEFQDKSIVLNYFSANNKLQSVVGNFIMAHKKAWKLSSGYDETLNMVRAGVDENGKNNMLYYGLKPMVLGNHYHLDHNESIIYGKNETHGYNKFNNLPYQNKPNWGLADYNEKKIEENIWQLEKI